LIKKKRRFQLNSGAAFLFLKIVKANFPEPDVAFMLRKIKNRTSKSDLLIGNVHFTI
jgi:hypothetical protein